METERDKFEREAREQKELQGAVGMIVLGCVGMVFAFALFVAYLGFVAVQLNEVQQITNGEI